MNEPRFRLAVVRGSLDKLKPRVLKKRAQRHAAHIDRMMKHACGYHGWARRRARMARMLDNIAAGGVDD